MLSILRFKLAGVALGVALLSVADIAPSVAFEDTPRALVDEAWQHVYREYVDRNFNQNDWMAVRESYLERDITTPEQAHQVIAEMLRLLRDPFTRFLSPDNIRELENDTSGGFVGVGLTLSLDPITREWVVVKPIEGTPAEEAGLQPKDVIVSINGRFTSEIEPGRASSYAIGEVGSKVFLQVRRDRQLQQYELVREAIELNPLTYQVQSTDMGKVGYIRLPSFTTKSPEAMKQAIQSLEAESVRGYVLDLRGNPGGVLDSGIQIAQLWLEGGALISSLDHKGEREEFKATAPALTRKPLQVLVDGESASASEIVAAALQENRRATIVGTQTFGKGIVQILEKMTDGSGLAITVARYFTPKGNNIHRVGIRPDNVVQGDASPSRNREGLPPEADLQYRRALRNLRQSMRAEHLP
ncbi:PDZ domain-containing protein [Synechococcales cyanobacterium C]|uniref:PDZ domain-containing protein n=1 Tax=Petrachloros mirabilis ULC683 TaxID=2781853 RepID=A0A8K1ZXN3_9CYAN|nr:S41 family peptidase [Petrachloros mirabilis]NCJ05783.1 PDZ domain-containing protein [Petrachloros mirabilis ULC683]